MIKKGRLLFISLVIPFFLYSCGIDKFYYLPQVSEGNIKRTGNTEVELSLPKLNDNPEFSIYKPNYCIFYRIYISNLEMAGDIQQSDLNLINPTLSSDFSSFASVTDPTNYSQLTHSNTFKNRNYHELELENANISDVLTGDGSTFKIMFLPIPGERPSMIDTRRTDPDTGAEYTRYLFRNNGSGRNNGIIFTTEPDRYFFYSPELVEETDYPIIAGGKNIDVALRSNSKEPAYVGHAYISMYIVTIGSAPDFSRIISKPTHVGVFKLPDL